MSGEVVITGRGVISSVGAGTDFEEAVFDNLSGWTAAPSLLADAEGLSGAFEIPGFNAKAWLGRKGLRMLDRSTLLLCVAAHMALESVGMEGEAEREMGLVNGTMFGSLASIVGFDWSAIEDGARLVNPMAFPNTVINSPAGHAGIKFGLRGVNTTISAGLTSSLEAIGYASHFVRLGRASMILAGGAEELSREAFIACRRSGLLTPEGPPRPFHRDRDGFGLGEGAALMMVEALEQARKEGRTPWAEIVGFGSAFGGDPEQAREAGVSALGEALDAAGIVPAQIGGIISGASGSVENDRAERDLLETVFEDKLQHIPLCAPKRLLGETLGAGGALGVAVALAALKNGALPLASEAEGPDFPGSSEGSLQSPYLLVPAVDCYGFSTALILKDAGERGSGKAQRP